jgi:hypothetical protein
MTKGGREGPLDRPMAESQLSELQNMRVLLEEARGLSRDLAYHRRARLESRLRGGPTDRGSASHQELESFPHSQRRTSMYKTSTADTAMADPSTATTTNDIVRNTPFVALRKPLAPILCSRRCRRVHTPKNVSLELEKATSG